MPRYLSKGNFLPEYLPEVTRRDFIKHIMLGSATLVVIPNLRCGKAEKTKEKSIGFEPDSIVVNDYVSFKLVYRVGEKGMAVDGSIRVFFHSKFRLLFNDYSIAIKNEWDIPDAENYITASTNGKGKLNIKMIPLLDEDGKFHTGCWTLECKVKNFPLKLGEQIEIIFGDMMKGGPGLSYTPVVHDFAPRIFVDADGKGEFVEIEPPFIKFNASEPEKLVAIAKSSVDVASEVDILVKAQDEYENVADGYRRTVSLEGTSPHKFTEKDSGIHIFKVKFSEPGIHGVKATDDKGKNTKSNPIVVGEREHNLYWGDLHNHSLLSDGLEEHEFFYPYARDVEALDFAALSDHDFLDWGCEGLTTNERWKIIKELAKKYNEPERFVTFLGYEWTHLPEHGGHFNVYYLEDDGPLFSHDPASETGDADKLWNALSGHEVITIPHHLSCGFGGQNWKFYNREKEPVVEICSVWGASEYYENPKPLQTHPIWQPTGEAKQGWFFQDALAKGYRVGVIGSGDNHYTRAGGRLRGRSPMIYRNGLAGVYAEKLTRESIFSAIKSRRCYATTGERIILIFKINGFWMGEEISASSEPEIYIKVNGTALLQKVEVVKYSSEGFGVIWSRKPDGTAIEETYHDIDFRENSIYYLRVIQADGEIAWSSPIWVKCE